MQEWRGLTSRKRDLLKKNPCRPPLADELEILTPALIGRQAKLQIQACVTVGAGLFTSIEVSSFGPW